MINTLTQIKQKNTIYYGTTTVKDVNYIMEYWKQDECKCDIFFSFKNQKEKILKFFYENLQQERIVSDDLLFKMFLTHYEIQKDKIVYKLDKFYTKSGNTEVLTLEEVNEFITTYED